LWVGVGGVGGGWVWVGGGGGVVVMGRSWMSTGQDPESGNPERRVGCLRSGDGAAGMEAGGTGEGKWVTGDRRVGEGGGGNRGGGLYWTWWRVCMEVGAWWL